MPPQKENIITVILKKNTDIRELGEIMKAITKDGGKIECEGFVEEDRGIYLLSVDSISFRGNASENVIGYIPYDNLSRIEP